MVKVTQLPLIITDKPPPRVLHIIGNSIDKPQHPDMLLPIVPNEAGPWSDCLILMFCRAAHPLEGEGLVLGRGEGP